MDYVYGTFCEEVKNLNYKGLETETAKTTVDNVNRTIAVDVLGLENFATKDYVDTNKGTKLYKHRFGIILPASSTSYQYYITVISNNPNPITFPIDASYFYYYSTVEYNGPNAQEIIDVRLIPYFGSSNIYVYCFRLRDNQVIREVCYRLESPDTVTEL